MKVFVALSVAVAALSAPSYANPRGVEVAVPQNLSDPAVAAAYVTELKAAIERVCRRETAPVTGPGVLSYRACIKATTADVIADDTTGLLAAALNKNTDVQVAQN
jgi:UrcA family protein